MAYLYVGSGEDYSTVQSAVDAASDGDIVLIEPGGYSEEVTLNKAVSLRANTENYTDTVIINSTTINPPLTIDYLPTGHQSIYLEGIKFTKVGGSWQRLTAILNANSYLSVYYNRCSIIAGANQYPISTDNNNLWRLEINNCYLVRGYAHILNCNWNNITSDDILKTELNNAYYCYLCTGAPDSNDNVTTTTSGYGPYYGEYYIDLPVATCSGITYVNDVPTGNIPVRLYRRSSGELVGETTSVSGGLFEVETPYEENHYVIGLYPASGTNALIYDWISPTISG